MHVDSGKIRANGGSGQEPAGEGTDWSSLGNASRPLWAAPRYRYADASRLRRELGISPVLATVMVRRGYSTPDAARRFLAADEIHDPFLLPGVRDAAADIMECIGRGGRITVHGDYDADGVCATALMVRALRRLGAGVDWHLPSRFDEGYGVAGETVERLAGRGTELMVTVDCGITATAEVELAHSLGLGVVVTDHHQVPEDPPACTVVHPAVGGYPCPCLCGTGVAFKLAQGLYTQAGRDPEELNEDLDMVALATVADVVELTGENRALVRRGLAAMAGTEKLGLRALMQVASIDPEGVTAQNVAFRLAPRINAAGRLYRADAGVELLLTEDADRAVEVAQELGEINRERRSEELQVLNAAKTAWRELPDAERNAPALVVAGEGWHQGVIGIVAGRLVEHTNRPAVVIAIGEDGGRGSARSIPAYDMYAALTTCGQHLRRFGGHRMAAGLEIDPERVPDFRTALIDHAARELKLGDVVPVEHVDALVSGDAVGLDLAEELEQMEPCGQGNPPVTLLVPHARVEDVRPMGEGKHVQFSVTSGGVRARAVGFGTGSKLPTGGADNHDVAARLEVNRWNGTVEPRLVLKGIYPVERDRWQPDFDAWNGTCVNCRRKGLGEAWWGEAQHEVVVDLSEWPPQLQRGVEREVVDWRGRGVLGVLGELLSTGESVAIVCADVSRRRGLIEEQLGPARFGAEQPLVVCARCVGKSPKEGTAAFADGEGGRLAMLDYEAATRDPSLLDDCVHVAVLDPPAFPHEAALTSRCSGGEKSDSPIRFVHLLYGLAENRFAQKVHEQKWGLHGPISAIYRSLVSATRDEGKTESGGLEEVLAGDGRHPRIPQVVGRSLRVLKDLGLVELAGPLDGRRSCVRARVSKDSVHLGDSPAYDAYQKRFAEGVEHLTRAAKVSPPAPLALSEPR